MKKVLITLTPVGRFYFGGDVRFEVKNEGKLQGYESTSYIVRSNCFPQQTSLLGMIRFLLLSNSNAFDRENQKISNKEDAVIKIGKEGFRAGIKCEANFGHIKSVGACFLQRRKTKDVTNEEVWTNFYFAPKLHGKYKIDFEKPSDAFYNGHAIRLPKIELVKNENRDIEQKEQNSSYNPKEDAGQLFFSVKGETILSSDIFREDIRVGIDKDNSGKTKKTAFFKQISYRFADNDKRHQYRFAFHLELSTEIDMTQYDGQIVLLGGDNSMFVLNVSDCVEKEMEILFNIDKNKESLFGYTKLVLTSNAFMENKKPYGFAVAETLPFRFLSSTIDSEDYNISSKKVIKSEKRYELYKAGSVFYFENESSLNEFVQELNIHREFCQIGYNQYQIINR